MKHYCTLYVFTLNGKVQKIQVTASREMSPTLLWLKTFIEIKIIGTYRKRQDFFSGVARLVMAHNL